jgi:hypothetical protein
MTPPAIVAAAVKAGLDLIAISDHNSAGNVAAVQQAAAEAGGGLTVIPGMELTSAEEVHVLALFPDLPLAERVSRWVKALLPPADTQYYSFFGEQPLLAADGSLLGMETVSLASATPLDLMETVNVIHAAGGLAVAAHVDRKAFSVVSQLGFFPKNSGFDGAELSPHHRSQPLPAGPVAPGAGGPPVQGLPVMTSSDSHFLDDVGTTVTEFLLAEPTFAELALAFSGRDERSMAHA